MSEKMKSKATKDTHVSGREPKDMILGECLSNYRAKACKSYYHLCKNNYRFDVVQICCFRINIKL